MIVCVKQTDIELYILLVIGCTSFHKMSCYAKEKKPTKNSENIIVC